jgi:hypothetical protein
MHPWHSLNPPAKEVRERLVRAFPDWEVQTGRMAKRCAALPGSKCILYLTQFFRTGLNNAALRAGISLSDLYRFFLDILQIQISRT